jgi:predicted nucleic acid-binding Zn ribbon protein
MVEYEKTCPMCQTLFTSHRRDKKFCTGKCRTEYYRRRKRSKKHKITEITTENVNVETYFPEGSISNWTYEKLMNFCIQNPQIPPDIRRMALQLKERIEERAKQKQDVQEELSDDIPRDLLREIGEELAKREQKKPSESEP